MSYFLTSSWSASISVINPPSGSTITSSSQYYYNWPVSEIRINWFEKTTTSFPNTNQSKPSITFHFNNDNVKWLYNTTGSRDVEYNFFITK